MAYKTWSSSQKGTYSGATAYVIGDFVVYNGSSYTCIANTTGNLPTVTAYWALVVSKGDTGSTGATGPTGPTGATGAAGTNGTSFQWLGTYNASTAYVPRDVVFYDGQSYVNILASTGNLPTNATYWELMVQKGTGDVSGPITNTDSYIPQWNGANSKLLKDGLAVPAGGLAGLTALGLKQDKVMTTLGDTIYGGASGAETRLPGNTTSQMLYWSQTGDGVNSSAPSWQPISAAGYLTFMFTKNASDIGGAYYDMNSLSVYVPTTIQTLTTTVGTTATLMGTFATQSGYPNLTQIPAGIFNLHFETQKAAGANNYYCYAEVYKRVLAGTETLIATSDNTTQTAVNTVVSQYCHVVTTSNTTLLSTDRIIVKIYGVLLSASASVDLLFDDTTNARIEFPSQVVDATNFVPYTGATKDVDLGSKTLTLLGSIGATASRVLKGWFTNLEITNLPTINGGTLASALSLSTYAPLTSPTFQTSVNGAFLTASEILVTDASKNIVSAPVATYPSLTELSYLKGATSSIQTQIGALPTASSTTTFTNKRINPRLVTTTSYTTDTGTSLDVSTCDQFEITAQAGALLFNAPGGTPVGGQNLIIRIKDNGTARALTYNAVFRAMGNALPSTTVLSKTLYMGLKYNATDTKWDLVAVAQEV